MRRAIFVTVLPLLAILPATFALADDFKAASERVEKQQHLAMIEKGISSNNARTIAMLGFMTYGNRACGSETIAEDDIEKVWAFLKAGPSLDEATRKSEAAAYADELEKAVSGLADFDKPGFCDQTRQNLVTLKKSWGLN
jgi:hypothetical protein